VAVGSILPNFDIGNIKRSNYHGAYVLGTFTGGLVAGLFHRFFNQYAREKTRLAREQYLQEKKSA